MSSPSSRHLHPLPPRWPIPNSSQSQVIFPPHKIFSCRKKKGPCKTDVKGKRMKCGAIQKNRISKPLFFYRSSVRVSNSRSPCRFPRDWCLFRGTHKRSGFSTIRLLERLDWVPYWKTNRLELSTETCLPSQHKANPAFIGLTLWFLKASREVEQGRVR